MKRTTTLLEPPAFIIVILLVLLFVMKAHGQENIWACLTCNAHCNDDQTCIAKNCKAVCGPSTRTTMEQWKPIVTATTNYTGLYEVSNMGRVRSLPRSGTRGGILKQGWRGLHQEYRGVWLSKNDVVRPFSVARLVAQAFVPNPQNLPEVDHVDTNKTNNRATNLEWVTKPEQIQRAYDKGLLHDGVGAQGSKHHMAKVTTVKVERIRQLYKGRGKGPSQAAIGKQFGITQTMVGCIVRRANWKHIPQSNQQETL